jgi:hypothetical protein
LFVWNHKQLIAVNSQVVEAALARFSGIARAEQAALGDRIHALQAKQVCCFSSIVFFQSISHSIIVKMSVRTAKRT